MLCSCLQSFEKLPFLIISFVVIYDSVLLMALVYLITEVTFVVYFHAALDLVVINNHAELPALLLTLHIKMQAVHVVPQMVR